MKILITGSNGMVGRNLQENAFLSAQNLLIPGSQEVNLTDFKQIDNYLSEYNPDLIIHSAGKVGGIQANIKEPVSFLVENMDMSRNIILAAKKQGIKKLLNISSSCMYPRNAQNPLKEEMILTGELEPTNEGYALAKILATRLCEYIAQENSGYQYKTIIPCNLYGRWDKFDPDYSHMIPAVIKKIHQAKQHKRNEIEIWGDGTARREFMYAADLANFIAEAVQRFDELPQLMNVGINKDYSIKEYYQIIAKVIGFTGVFRHDLSKPTGMKQKLVDVEKLKYFNWEHKTSLEQGIEKTYQFYLENSGNE